MNPVDLAKKANPCLRNKEHKQEQERKQPNYRWMINLTKVGVSQTDERRNCSWQINLSKTQNLMMAAAYDYKGFRVVAYPGHAP